MTPEIETWLLASGGAVFLISGGALLRSAALARVRQELQALRSKLDGVAEREVALQSARDQAEQKVAQAEVERATLQALVERQSEERTKPPMDAVSSLQQTQQGVERLTRELGAERQLVKQMEASLEEVRSALLSAQEQLQEVRSQAEMADDRARAAADPPPMRPPLPSVRPQDQAALGSARAELAEARKALAEITSERDAARAKVEALERLVEGVRARSRELSNELKMLKEVQK